MKNFFRRIFGGRKPRVIKVPKPRRSQEQLGGGHRGVAIGSLKKPDYSAENISQWTTLPADAVAGFVYDQEVIFVHSTNVESVRYFFETEQLLVTYYKKGKPSRTYLYDNCSEDEAIQFAKAQSKGVWVWDNLRIRGTKTGHKKPYRLVSVNYRPNAPPMNKEDIDRIFSEGYEPPGFD